MTQSGAKRSNAHLTPDDLVRHRALAGTVEDVDRQVLDIAALGCTQIAFFPMPTAGMSFESVIRTFASQVMPKVHSPPGCVAEPGPPCGWTGKHCTVPGCKRSG